MHEIVSPGTLDIARLLLDFDLVQVAAVSGLVLLVDAGQGLLQGILGGRIEHLRLDAGVIVRPVSFAEGGHGQRAVTSDEAGPSGRGAGIKVLQRAMPTRR